MTATRSDSGRKVVVTCSECGVEITDGVFCRGEPEDFAPLFCSEACAVKYRPEVLTITKLRGLFNWINNAPGTP